VHFLAPIAFNAQLLLTSCDW